MGETLTITLPYPPAILHPNKRTRSYMHKAREVKRARGDAALVALAAMRTAGHAPPAFDGLAWIDAEWFHPQKRFSSHDDDNLTTWLKPSRDGLADAGVIADDQSFRMRHHRQHQDLNNPRVVLTITPID